jgi:hypothetical protein
LDFFHGLHFQCLPIAQFRKEFDVGVKGDVDGVAGRRLQSAALHGKSITEMFSGQAKFEAKPPRDERAASRRG